MANPWHDPIFIGGAMVVGFVVFSRIAVEVSMHRRTVRELRESERRFDAELQKFLNPPPAAENPLLPDPPKKIEPVPLFELIGELHQGTSEEIREHLERETVSAWIPDDTYTIRTIHRDMRIQELMMNQPPGSVWASATASARMLYDWDADP